MRFSDAARLTSLTPFRPRFLLLAERRQTKTTTEARLIDDKTNKMEISVPQNNRFFCSSAICLAIH
jgi:hypothetical protein